MAAVLPGGQRQYAGGYSSYRGMSGYGGNTQMHISDLDQVSTPQLFYICFYNHAHRLRLEKLL